MYLSHPVRRIREAPDADASVALVAELAPEVDPEEFASTVAELDGSVDEELRYDAWRVTVPQPAVASLCAFDGLVRVETADTLTLGVDAEAADALDDAGDEFEGESGRR